ncbi:MAG: P1 family peptidase [Woeseiaceae bacterium]|nr:P1 family peptidase [Woeseiaceae bacterium]
MNKLLLLFLLMPLSVPAADAPRARDLGIPFDGTPGPLNAITDVAGVTVGFETIIEDLDDGRAVRTGVTAILPRGRDTNDRPVFGGWFSLNGNGEMTGTTWIEESGFVEGPIMITNTHSVGAVHEGTIRWRYERGAADSTGYWWSLPVVAETWDGYLNDINGFHVRPEHAFAAIEAAKGGPVAEGNVGGGTAMNCFEYKCGTGTASRVTEAAGVARTVGVLVQANFGRRDNLLVAGVPVGRHLRDEMVFSSRLPDIAGLGSIIIVVGTDAPLFPHQLKRLVRRAALGLARTGSIASNGSGDIFVAFSTANPDATQVTADVGHRMLGNEDINPLFLATVQATEEAIINALVAGRTMTGNRGNRVTGIDHDELRRVLREYGRLDED